MAHAVLTVAQKINIDGIVAYASDPTAAYVEEKMWLHVNPCQSAITLAHQDLFRDFLKKWL